MSIFILLGSSLLLWIFTYEPIAASSFNNIEIKIWITYLLCIGSAVWLFLEVNVINPRRNRKKGVLIQAVVKSSKVPLLGTSLRMNISGKRDVSVTYSINGCEKDFELLGIGYDFPYEVGDTITVRHLSEDDDFVVLDSSSPRWDAIAICVFFELIYLLGITLFVMKAYQLI